METVIILGFELEVYLPDEFATQYTLLSFFAQTRAEHYSHLTSQLSRRLTPLPPQPRPQPAELAELNSVITHLATLATQARLLAVLASTLSDLYSLLLLLSLLPVPARPFSTTSLRYELRMKPFLGIGTPNLPGKEELEAATVARDSDVALATICDEADEKLPLAKAEVARLKAMAPVEGKFEGSQADWDKEWRGHMLSVVQIGVGVAAVREVVQKSGLVTVGEVRARREGEKGWIDGVKVEIPSVEARKERGWVVPKVVLVGK